MADWYDDFLRDGYAVVPSVIDETKARQYQQAAFQSLRSLSSPELDLADARTWTPANLPFISSINTLSHYGIVHERFMWDIRLEPGVIAVFARLWKTEELLVSFDALNITLPHRPGRTPRGKWPHVDQSPFRKGLQCIQGIVSLSDSGPADGGLTVYPGTHKVTEAFFADHTDAATWSRKDFYGYTPEQMDWFAAQGFREHKVLAKPGDLLIWDSRLVHYGAEPTAQSNIIRTAAYVSYAPASFAGREALEAKQKAFAGWLSTTHWPHDNINLRVTPPLLPDGAVDTRRREPREKPVLTERLSQLAGIAAY